MALTARTIRPVQRFGEIEICLGISIRRELQNTSPATQKSGQEKDEEQEHTWKPCTVGDWAGRPVGRDCAHPGSSRRRDARRPGVAEPCACRKQRHDPLAQYVERYPSRPRL